jgi:hypothetical protein
MKLAFLGLTAEQRSRAIEEAAARQGVSPVIIEKDFWVCFALSLLYRSEFGESLVFKGGTSLSKVFGAIKRFSEDIDLSLAPEFLNLPKPGLSRNQANKWMLLAEQACVEAVRDRITPELNRQLAVIVQDRPAGLRLAARFEFQVAPQAGAPVVFFHYPTTQPSGFDYLERAVKLEFGSLTEQFPTGRYAVRPWLADVFPGLFTEWTVDVAALEIERTFWEKATILHAEYHRPAEKPTPDRFSRHYADLFAIASHPEGKKAIQSPEVCAQVVRWKSRFFGSAWANYNSAIPGGFRLVPPSYRFADLKRDYEAMREMYLSEPVPFDGILDGLSRLESDINRMA